MTDPQQPSGQDLLSELVRSGEPEAIQRLYALLVHNEAPRDPVIDKLDAAGLKKLLDNSAAERKQEHERRMLAMRLQTAVVFGALILIGILCWMFLTFDKTETLEKVIALMIGLVGGGIGGFGVGRMSKSGGEG